MQKLLPAALALIVTLAHSGSTAGKNTIQTKTVNAESEVVPAEKAVYLTFDADMTEGMRARLQKKEIKSWYDPEIIKYLDAQQVQATIFSTGMFAEVYPDLIRSLGQDQNFAIENHSYDHPAFETKCYGLRTAFSDQDKIEQIEKTQNILKNLTGKDPQYFRYPGLCHNSHDDQLVHSLGLKTDTNLLISGDAFRIGPKAIQTMAQRIIRDVRPGSVIVMHLGGPNAPDTAGLVQEIVPELRAQGFEFKKL